MDKYRHFSHIFHKFRLISNNLHKKVGDFGLLFACLVLPRYLKKENGSVISERKIRWRYLKEANGSVISKRKIIRKLELSISHTWNRGGQKFCVRRRIYRVREWSRPKFYVGPLFFLYVGYFIGKQYFWVFIVVYYEFGICFFRLESQRQSAGIQNINNYIFVLPT